MNNPIISPYLIYLMSVSTGLRVAFGLVGILGLIASVFAYVPNSIEEWGKTKTILKYNIGFIICILLSILIPSETIIIKMIVAKNITPNNLSLIVKEGKELKENIKKDVLDIIMAIGEKSNKDK
jgi:hypothetical protein